MPYAPNLFPAFTHTHISKIKLGFLLTVESRWQKISFTHRWTGWTTRTNRRSKLTVYGEISRCWFSILNLNRGYCALPGSFQRLLSRYGPECDRCIVVVKWQITKDWKSTVLTEVPWSVALIIYDLFLYFFTLGSVTNVFRLLDLNFFECKRMSSVNQWSR